MNFSPLDIQSGHIKIIIKILRDYIPEDTRTWVFGSRAIKGKAKKYSDLDLALDGNGVTPSLIHALQDAFEESDLPYKTDIINLNAVSPEFRKIIDETKTELKLP